MAMILLKGTVDAIGTADQRTEKLSVMKFVLGTDQGPIEIEIINKGIQYFLDKKKIGDEIGVNVEIQGRKSDYNGKSTIFHTFRHVNSFPIFTRSNESFNQSNGMGAGSGGYGASNTNSNFQSDTSYGAQGSVPPSPKDQLPF